MVMAAIGSLYCTVCDEGVMLILGGWFPGEGFVATTVIVTVAVSVPPLPSSTV